MNCLTLPSYDARTSYEHPVTEEFFKRWQLFHNARCPNGLSTTFVFCAAMGSDLPHFDT